MKLFLIGLPGSGKSTIGKELATALGILFVDLDLEIEKQEGRKITSIFKNDGENFFRQVESALLKEWCAAPLNFVMATGGGAPCYLNNMELIKNSGISFFLDVPPKEIARRIKNNQISDRPLLASVHPEELKDKIEFLRSQRISFYLEANFSIQSEAIKPKDILQKLGV
jgi:shikimate kinase